MISILGQNIKKLREEKGISLYELEKRSGVGRSSLYKLENGDIQDMNGDNIAKISKALEVPTHTLIKGHNINELELSDMESALMFVIDDEDLTIDNKIINKYERDLLMNAITITINSIKASRKNND